MRETLEILILDLTKKEDIRLYEEYQKQLQINIIPLDIQNIGIKNERREILPNDFEYEDYEQSIDISTDHIPFRISVEYNPNGKSFNEILMSAISQIASSGAFNTPFYVNRYA